MKLIEVLELLKQIPPKEILKAFWMIFINGFMTVAFVWLSWKLSKKKIKAFVFFMVVIPYLYKTGVFHLFKYFDLI